MADMLIDDVKFTACLDAEADSIRAKTGDSNDIPFDYANNKGFADAIAAIPSGTTITDGIVINARNANGKATEIDVYGTMIGQQQFYNRTSGDGGWTELESVVFKDNVTEIKSSAFSGCSKITQLDLSHVTSVGTSAFQDTGVLSFDLPNLVTTSGYAFSTATKATQFSAPKLTTINNREFWKDSAFTSITVGSVGYGVTYVHNGAFEGCTNQNLIVTIYAIGSNVDSFVTAIRNRATYATIIIKASEATTYNGTSYAAGDTILTSEVSA